MYQLSNVSKTYRTARGQVTALDNVSLTIEKGEWLVVKGATGGGKSTLLSILGALECPTKGAVQWAGPGGSLRMDTASERRLAALRARRIGFVFQSFNLIPTLSALDNVVAGLRPVGLHGRTARTKAMDALTGVGLADRAQHLPGTMSGGQQQRVAIARALAKEPEVLLADEPTGNLDEDTRDEITGVLRAAWRRGVTVVMVTHDGHLADTAERVVMIERGEVLQPAPAR